MSRASPAPARFTHVFAPQLPTAVKVNGTVYAVAAMGSPDGPGRLPADLLAVANVAHQHVAMARHLIELTAAHEPHEYASLLKDRLEEQSPGRWVGTCSEVGRLAHEIACQNGAEIVSALFDQLCMANTTGGPIRVGAICEQNAHAAAFAAALQISNQVLAGTRVSIGTEELGRIEELIEREAFIVSQNRREGRTAAGQAMPDRRKQDMCTFSLFHDPALYLDDEELREAFATANACASVGQAAFQGIKGNLPWAIVSELIVSLQREASNSEGLIEGTYEDFAEFGLRVAVGGVSEVSAHAAAWALAKWVLHEIWTAATEPEGRFSDFNLSTVRDAYPQVVAHFVQLLDFEIAEVTTLLKQEAILVARDRALRMRQLKLEQATRQANRIAPVATEAVQGRAQPHSALNVCPGGFTCEGKEFALSGKPLQVLRAFLYARQHRLTARDLQDSVWGDDSAVGPETVKTAVSAVRSALRTAARKLGLKIAKDPLPCIDRGTKNLAWKLAFPQ